MSRIRPLCLDPDCSDRSARSEVLPPEEPDEEEEEEDEGDVTDDEGDDDVEDEDGYSVRCTLMEMVKDEARRLHQRC